ncbi:MAG: eukaryotic-like serine/threonine-protein kinase, partial [Actinomycetota bacterium]|nr:eukaryotic-like serine/threonine-protein kinase [Actinomycetota bacterium]
MSPRPTETRRLVGRYRLDSELGRGAMGTVWSAYDEVLHRPVAVKEVRLSLVPVSERAIVRERTLREARATAMLSHPNVVTLYDVVEVDSEPYVVMELLPSRSLASYIAERGTLSQGETAEIGSAVASALMTAHRAGITHRDVKPGNVLIGTDGQIKLTDFGIARNAAESSMTQTGTVLGSPPYIAPEVAMGRAVGPPADLWGLGATLFACLEGRPPYDAGDPVSTVSAVVHGEIPHPTGHGPVVDVIRGLMVKDPGMRMPLPAVRRRLRPLMADPEGPMLSAPPAPATTEFRLPQTTSRPTPDDPRSGLIPVRGRSGTLVEGAGAPEDRPRTTGSPTPSPSPRRPSPTPPAARTAPLTGGPAADTPAPPAEEAGPEGAQDAAPAPAAAPETETPESPATGDHAAAAPSTTSGATATATAAAAGAVAAGVSAGAAAAAALGTETPAPETPAPETPAPGTQTPAPAEPGTDAGDDPGAAAGDEDADATPVRTGSADTPTADDDPEAESPRADEDVEAGAVSPEEAPAEASSEEADADGPPAVEADAEAAAASDGEPAEDGEDGEAAAVVAPDAETEETAGGEDAHPDTTGTSPEAADRTTGEDGADDDEAGREPATGTDSPAADGAGVVAGAGAGGVAAAGATGTTPDDGAEGSADASPEAEESTAEGGDRSPTADDTPATPAPSTPSSGTARPATPPSGAPRTPTPPSGTSRTSTPSSGNAVPEPSASETTMVTPRPPESARPAPRPGPTTTSGGWSQPYQRPPWAPMSAPPRTGAPQALAADPGPLPFAPSRHPAPEPSRTRRIGIVVLVVVLALAGLVGGYAAARLIGGQPPFSVSLAPEGPVVDGERMVSHSDDNARYSGTGMGFTALVPSTWQQFRLQQPGGDIVVRYVSDDADR